MSSITDHSIGFIGLGLMGRPMCVNLKDAGAELVIYNRSRPKVDELAERGMSPAGTARELAGRVGIVIVMVSDTPAVSKVLEGDDGVLAGLNAGALVIDMGTTAVPETRKFAELVRARGADYVDAPVSGGVVGAEAGSLAIMAGGSEEAIASAMPVFRVLGRNITHVGDVGAGQVAKAANQVIVGLTIGAVAEALTLAKRSGVDPAKVRAALQGGFAASRVLEVHGERMIKGTFEPGGKAVTQRKDLFQALELAKSLDLELPATALNMALYERLIDQGGGELDHSALVKVIDR
ncbi:MAG: NAD(P)-dependent oxidoreductase [Gammaproteobacteria bacterium]|nr:NAD(P)-dependent oxidoreductase [Gammaproteobacteria bacterium]